MQTAGYNGAHTVAVVSKVVTSELDGKSILPTSTKLLNG